nr:immunoglobulin heavy chain junction region [Mus musculus]
CARYDGYFWYFDYW